MDIDCKKFAKDVRSLDKEMRSWDAFVGLDNTVKNMITSLRAVSELQNPAIRDRHWQQLMQATQVLPPGGRPPSLWDGRAPRGRSWACAGLGPGPVPRGVALRGHPCWLEGSAAAIWTALTIFFKILYIYLRARE